MNFPSSENKGVISFAVTAKLICVFVFAYAHCWFSHEAAQIWKKVVKIFDFVWTWQLSWSCDPDATYIILFIASMEVPHKHSIQLAMNFQS